MTTTIKQNVIHLLNNLVGDKAKTSRLANAFKSNNIVFPTGDKGIEMACFLVATILEKNPTLLAKNEENKVHLQLFSKAIGLTSEAPTQHMSPKSSGHK